MPPRVGLRELGTVLALSTLSGEREGIGMIGVMVGSSVAVGRLLCDRRGAPAPEGQGLPASLRVGAAQGAHCHD